MGGFDEPVISADGHIDMPLLPHDLFVEHAPPSMRDRMPRVVERDGSKEWVDEHGVRLALVGGTGNTGQVYVPGQSTRFDRMNESAFWDDAARGVFRTSDPALRIAAQDQDGIAGEVLYGVLGMANAIADPDVSAAVMQAYNEWLAGFCAYDPTRLAGVACLPSKNPEAAAAEIRRCADRGLRAVEVAMTHDLLPLWRQEFAPIWQAANECGAIVHLHTIGPPVDTSLATTPREVAAWLGGWLTVFQLRMIDRVAELIFGGILHAHPELRVVIGESGVGWLPYVLERMDDQWSQRFTHLELTMPPSGYWQRQMAATFQVDEAGLALADRIGVHTLMWGNDFPHGDGVWPDSRAVIDKQFAGVPAATRRAITYDNAARIYGFPPRS
jgi:predicted TIM-barrel fold metal-dependent hydrolase